MKFNKDKIILYLSIIYVVLTFVINIVGYFALPAKIATQFSFTGKATSHTPTPIYLMISFAIILLLSYRCNKTDEMQKPKYVFADTLIVILNFVAIITQIK